MKNLKEKIIVINLVIAMILIFACHSFASSTDYTNIDVDNKKGTSYWKNIPIV